MEPEAWMTCLPPDRPHLTLGVITPDIAYSVSKLTAENVPCRRPHVLVPSRKYDLVGFKFCAIGEAQAVGEDLFDLLALFDFYFAVDDELRAADI